MHDITSQLFMYLTFKLLPERECSVKISHKKPTWFLAFINAKCQVAKIQFVDFMIYFLVQFS